MNQIPRKLGKEPLVEAVWQALLEDPLPSGIADLLPGILYLKLKASGGPWHSQRMTGAEIPPNIARQDPLLRYAVKYRLVSEKENIIYQTGDSIVTVNCRRPYPGWDIFLEKILAVITILSENFPDLKFKQFDLRYLDFVPEDILPTPDGLKIKPTIEPADVRSEAFSLHVKLSYDSYPHTLQIMSPVSVSIEPEGNKRGTLIDLTTSAIDFSHDSVKATLNSLHDASKKMFFQQILMPELIDKLEPVY